MHFRNASRQIIIIDNMDTEDVVKFAEELAGYVWEKDKFELNIGIDSAQSYDIMKLMLKHIGHGRLQLKNMTDYML